MANHENARTTGLYDRRNDQVRLDDVERILIRSLVMPIGPCQAQQSGELFRLP